MTFKQISARYLEPASHVADGARHRRALPALEHRAAPLRRDDHPRRPGRLHVFSKIKPAGSRRTVRPSMAEISPPRHREVFRRQLRHPQAQPHHRAQRSSSCCSGRPAAARRRRCAPSPGWRRSTRGDILIDGKPVQRLEPGDRDIAFVFQLFALYPHLTAYDNIAFPLRARRARAGEVDAGRARSPGRCTSSIF